MATVITTQELKEKIDSGNRYLLVDVLSPQSYQSRHLPTAVNIPFGANFVNQVSERLSAGKDTTIIVYCMSSTCTISPAASAALERAGFKNILHYKDGLAGWQDAGYEFGRVI